MVRVHADAETHAQDAFFAGRQAGQNRRARGTQIGLNRSVKRLNNVPVFDEITQMAVLFISDRCFQADRFFGYFQNLANLFQRHGQFFGQLFRRWFSTDFVQHLTARSHQFVDRFDHVNRDADGTRLIRNGTRDGLANPPCGIC